MALEADGSNPSIHPSCMAENQARTVPRRFWLLFTLACIYGGMSPSGKARDFDSRIRGFESRHPSIFDLLAQSAEHLPFKQGVRGSNPRRGTRKGTCKSRSLFRCRRCAAGDALPPPDEVDSGGACGYTDGDGIDEGRPDDERSDLRHEKVL